MNIIVEPTPNPNALKFITPSPVKAEGKTAFKNPHEAKDVPLALALFDLRGVDQLHFFDNVITLSKFSFEPWDSLEPAVMTCIENHLPDHNAHFVDHDPEVERRKNLPKEMLTIEELLDKKIRPGLQGDGGDIAVESFENNVLIVRYQGACGTCPSSTTGTLEAIRGILREEYDPNIEVYIAPEM